MLYRTPDPSYNEQQLRYKRQWQARHAAQRDTPYIAYDRAEEAQRKAQTLRDIADNDRELQMEAAAFKGIQAARVLPDAFEGLFTVFGVIDDAGTRTHPGCFKNVRIDIIDYFHRHDHGRYGAVAQVKAIWEITRDELPIYVRAAYPEATGGAVVVRQYLDTPNGRAARAWVTGGFLKEMSYSYFPGRRTTHTLPDGRAVTDIYDLELNEVSDALQGAVPGTMAITGTKHVSFLQGRYRRV